MLREERRLKISEKRGEENIWPKRDGIIVRSWRNCIMGRFITFTVPLEN
jgi:hypothetical protein